MECPLPFPNVVHRYAPLTIAREVSTDGGNTWHEAGVSQNEVFLYRATTVNWSPGCTKPFRTVLYLACNNGGSEPDEIAANTWAMFAGPAHVKAWSETDRDYTRPLCYWGVHNGGPDHYTAAELLSDANGEEEGDIGDGECDAWCDLLMEAWKVNWVGGFRQYEVRAPLTCGALFYVREVGLVGTPLYLNDPPFIYDEQSNLDLAEPGLPGQNSVPHPSKKLFPAHWLVRRGATYYDPSYGITAVGEVDYTMRAIGLFADPDNDTHLRRPMYCDWTHLPVYVRFLQWGGT